MGATSQDTQTRELWSRKRRWCEAPSHGGSLLVTTIPGDKLVPAAIPKSAAACRDVPSSPCFVCPAWPHFYFPLLICSCQANGTGEGGFCQVTGKHLGCGTGKSQPDLQPQRPSRLCTIPGARHKIFHPLNCFRVLPHPGDCPTLGSKQIFLQNLFVIPRGCKGREGEKPPGMMQNLKRDLSLQCQTSCKYRWEDFFLSERRVVSNGFTRKMSKENIPHFPACFRGSSRREMSNSQA